MCGIAGIVDLRGGRVDPAPLELMNRLQAHRGPDGEGVWSRGPVALGHRRLAIFELSEAGAQPMRIERDGRELVVTYNGELYNHPELRAELEGLGEVFQTGSDTEVLLVAYARWGTEAFRRFNGMFACAIWDGGPGRLVLARDRLGIKPLYLFESGARLTFASEAKAVLAAAPAARALDEPVLFRYLAAGQQDESPRTFFRGVVQLPPGTWRSYDAAGGGRAEGRYWTPPRPGSLRPSDPVAALRERLEASVRLRLRSEVPVGTCLSGGIDSSAIVGLAAGHSPEPIRTFTAVYDDPGYDERQFARAVVSRHGCLAAEVQPRVGGDLVPLLDTVGWFHDEPCARPGILSQWAVMELAAGQVTVLLDGQGGDELLLGYVAHVVPYLRSLGGRVLRRRSGLRTLARDAARLLGQPTTTPRGPGLLAEHLGWALYERGRGVLARAAGRGQSEAGLRPEVLRSAFAPPQALSVGSLVDQASWQDVFHRTIPALLHHEDRTAMAFSLEARVPFLDHELVELCLGLDYREKLRGGRLKGLLRDAVADVLPPAVRARRDKLGYPTPIGRWLREGGPAVKELLFDGFAKRGYLTPGAMEQAWRGLEAGSGSPWALYRYLSAELWLRRFLDGPLEPLPAPKERS
jgi:asparagine synthase (glutamine-hydrolysing)